MIMKKCINPICNHEIPDDSVSCPFCSMKWKLVCPECGFEGIPDGAAFCPHCGHRFGLCNFPPKSGAKANTSSVYQKNVDAATDNHMDDVRIGDYFYSDGTVSHMPIAGRKPAGIVFSLKTTPTEKDKGWTHDLIMALKPASLSVFRIETYYSSEMLSRTVLQDTTQLLWGDEKILPSPHRYFPDVKKALEDRDGYVHTYSGNTDTDCFEAFRAARDFDVELPKGTTSGWYMPALGQLREILENLFNGKFKLAEPEFELESECFDLQCSKYGCSMSKVGDLWSSSQFNDKEAFMIELSLNHVEHDYKVFHKRIWPIAAF